MLLADLFPSVGVDTPRWVKNELQLIADYCNGLTASTKRISRPSSVNLQNDWLKIQELDHQIIAHVDLVVKTIQTVLEKGNRGQLWITFADSERRNKSNKASSSSDPELTKFPSGVLVGIYWAIDEAFDYIHRQKEYKSLSAYKKRARTRKQFLNISSMLSDEHYSRRDFFPPDLFSPIWDSITNFLADKVDSGESDYGTIVACAEEIAFWLPEMFEVMATAISKENYMKEFLESEKSLADHTVLLYYLRRHFQLTYGEKLHDASIAVAEAFYPNVLDMDGKAVDALIESATIGRKTKRKVNARNG